VFPVIFPVLTSPEFEIPIKRPEVAEVAEIELLTILLPVMFRVPSADELEIQLIPFVVEVLPPSTQFCTVLLFIFTVAVFKTGVSPRLFIPNTSPDVEEVGLFETEMMLLFIVVAIVPEIGDATE
jgi:hypothetical protein